MSIYHMISLILWALSIAGVPVMIYLRKPNLAYGAFYAFLMLSFDIIIGLTTPNLAGEVPIIP